MADNPIEPVSVAYLLEKAASEERIFLRYYDGGELRRSISFREFVRESVILASFLRTRGICGQAQDRVAVVMYNSPELLVTYAALMLLGAVIVPVSPRENEAYIERICKISRSKLVVSESKLNISHENIVFPSLSDAPPEWASQGQHWFSNARTRDPNNPAALFYSSGTTGNPKGVLLSQRNILANVRSLLKVHQMGPEHIHQCVLPLHHVNAFGFSFLTSLAAQSCLVLHRQFHAPSFWEVIAKESVHVASIVPEIARILCESAVVSPPEPSPELRYFVTAASPLSRQLWRRFSQIFPTRLIQGYGLSEAVNFSLLTPPHLPADIYDDLMRQEQRPTVGCAIPGNEVAIFADGKFQGERETGEVIIRGENVMIGYEDNAAATEEVLVDGWLKTGDLGYYVRGADNRNYFFLSGRKKEVIKRNSETIVPEEIEDILRSVTGLDQIAVVGFDHDLYGEEVGVVICGERLSLQDRIASACVRNLSFPKRPKVIRFADDLPRTASLKIQRRKLKPLFVEFRAHKFAKGQLPHVCQ